MVPKDKVISVVDEFKKFAFKGNVIDMAVGVIIGAAFGKIVDSLVKSIIMPLINSVMPTQGSYTDWVWTVNGKDVPVGVFLGEVVNFFIVALVLYVFIVKFLGWIMRSRTQEAAAPPPPPDDVRLLTEIRDLLKARGGELPTL
jgi:large conductance mechanosensitive channel